MGKCRDENKVRVGVSTGMRVSERREVSEGVDDGKVRVGFSCRERSEGRCGSK